MIDFLWGLLIAGVFVSVYHGIREVLRKRKDVQYLRIKDLKMTPHFWRRFQGLALACNKNQKSLISEALLHYLEERTK